MALLPRTDSKRILALYFDDVFRVIDTDRRFRDFYIKPEKREEYIEIVVEQFRSRLGGEVIETQETAMEEEEA